MRASVVFILFFFLIISNLQAISCVEVVAHKGASSTQTENTLDAFKEALRVESNYVEFDVRLSRDGHVVVSHDATLSRLSGRERFLRIQDLSLSEIRELDDEIATLDEVLDLPLMESGLFVELKPSGENNETLVNGVLQSIQKRYGPGRDRSILTGSASLELVSLLLRRRAPNTVVAIAGNAESLQEARLLNPGRIALHFAEVTGQTIQALHRQGIKVWAYNVDDPFLAGQMLSLKVDGIITTDPERMREWLPTRTMYQESVTEQPSGFAPPFKL